MANPQPAVSEKTIGRLSLYRRLLKTLAAAGETNIYSHQLGAMADGTATQVRRDLMVTGYTGSPTRGYDIADLIEAIGSFLDASQPVGVAMVGVGNLGRAIMAYFHGHRPKLAIVAAFDTDPRKVNRVTGGVAVHPSDVSAEIIRSHNIRVAIITVPARAAQDVCDELVRAGVRSILNFAPVRLRVPPGVYVEHMDVTTGLEKVAYFARHRHSIRRTTWPQRRKPSRKP